MVIPVFYGVKKREEEEDAPAETEREREDARRGWTRNAAALAKSRMCVRPRGRPDAQPPRHATTRFRPRRPLENSRNYQQVFRPWPREGAERAIPACPPVPDLPLALKSDNPPTPLLPRTLQDSNGRCGAGRAPRPKAHWVKLRCVVWYYVQLSQLRKGITSGPVVPGITHATRAILEGRINAICYEGEEEVEDPETPARPRRTPA